VDRKLKHRIVELLKDRGIYFRNNLAGLLLFSKVEERHQLFLEIKRNNLLNSKVKNGFYGNGLQRFNNINWMYNPNLNDYDAIKYACDIISLFDKKIEKFCALRREYNTYLINNNYEKSIEVLDKIDNEICISMWSCGQRMLIKEYSMGLEQNKIELSKISDTVKDNIILYILYCYSSLAEKELSYDNYVVETSKQLKKSHNQDVANYLFNKLLPENIYNSKNLSLTLQLDSQISLIDLYCSLEKCIPTFFVDEICGENEQGLYPLINTIRCTIFDNLRLLYNKDFSHKTMQEIQNYYNVFEAFSAGDYICALNMSKEMLKQNFDNFTIVEILCCSVIFGHLEFPAEFKNTYVEYVYSIYKMDDNYKESIFLLKQEMKKYYGTNLGIRIYSFLQNKYLIKNVNNIDFASECIEEFLSPYFCKYLKGDKKNKFVDSLNEFAQLSISMSNRKYIDKSDDLYKKIPNNISCIINAKALCEEEKYAEAQKQIEKLTISNEINPYFNEMLSYIKLSIYNGEKNHLKAISLLVGIFYDNKNLFERLILSGVYFLPRRIKDQKLQSNIFYPIFIYLLNNNDYSKQIIAYRNFLDYNKFESIINALDVIKIEDNRNFLFFFSKVCTVNLLKRDVTLHKLGISPENARIKILLKILEIDKSREYIDEINNILTTETLKDNLKTITKSRINMDDEKILLEHIEQWSETYNKYLKLTELSASFIQLSLEDHNFILFRNSNSHYNQHKVNQEILVFDSLVDQILDECLFSTKYGLETYLSSRIRHGYCEGQLTNFLSELHLLSYSLDDSKSSYTLDKHWEMRLDTSSDTYLCLKTLISEFTQKVELKVNEILKEWLRIKCKEEQVGDFDYREFLLLVHNYRTIEKIDEFTVFYHIIIDAFWHYTTKLLEKLRSKIKNELTDYYISIIGELQESIQEIDISHNIKQEILSNCNVAKSRVVRALGEFEEVFYVNNNDYNNFTMKDMTDSSQRLILKLNNNISNCNWKISVDEDFIFNGRYFVPFVDIMCILLNNAIQHSGMEQGEKLEIEININEVTDREEVFNVLPKANEYKNIFSLKVSNSLGSSIDISALTIKIKGIFEEVEKKSSNLTFAQKEGGTGIYKLCNIARNNIEAPYCIFYAIGEKSISLEYCFAIDNIIIKEENDEYTNS